MKLRIRRPYAKVALALALVLVIVVAMVLLLRFWERQHFWVDESQNPGYHSITGEEELEEVFYNDRWYIRRRGIETLLVLGIDKDSEIASAETDMDGYINSQQCDFLMLVILDHENKTYTGLHINRDTMTSITVIGPGGDEVGSFVGQIALAHTYGSGGRDSCKNTTKAVSELLSDTKVDHYVSVTMDAVPIVNDAVGGVTVTIEDDFSAVREDFVMGETITLMGEQSLAYVRTRLGMGEPTNLARMERQRVYMTGLMNAYKSRLETDPELVLSVLMEINDYLVSDCTVNDLSDIADSVYEYEFAGIKYIDGEAVMGDRYIEYNYDQEALNRLVLELFFEESKPQTES